MVVTFCNSWRAFSDRITPRECKLLRLRFSSVFPFVKMWAVLLACCFGQVPNPPSSESEVSLRTFLQEYARRNAPVRDRATRYLSAFVELNNNGKQDIIVYLTGQDWCGSGGCTTLVLEAEQSSYKVIARITITRPPIRVLTRESKGWHDLGVWVQGGGIRRGYEADLSFDGQTYPSNPSTLPAQRLAEAPLGEIVISKNEEGTLLYE